MINTLNESSLHKALKNIYSLEENFKTEEKVGQWICDIVDDTKTEIIEIQTTSVSKLKDKLTGLFALDKKVKIVHPIIIEKIIKTFDSNGNLIYKRKSPKKENIYSVFKQITGLTEILLHKNFSLEIIEISVTEVRTKTKQPVQTQNKSRHHLRTWIKTDKILNQIHKTYIFKTAEDYLTLLPQFKLNSNRDDFTVKQTQKLLENIKNLKNAKTSASIMIWVLKKMDLIVEIYKEKREIHYKIR